VGNFTQVNLVADTAAGHAAVTDPNLVNPWGVSFSTTSPFWVSDTGTGLATLYNGAGARQNLVVTIPTAAGGTHGPATGQVFNSTADFAIPAVGASHFIFASLDGSISAWNGGNAAVKVADRSAQHAAYTGLAMATDGGANFLYGANFGGGTIDKFDGTFAFKTSFTDPKIPAGYAPFNVQNINGQLYVTYAKVNPVTHESAAGVGNGFVDVFTPSGTVAARLIGRGTLNAPWGLVQAPAGFGALGGDLLVGNFGDGKVFAYDINTGKLKGQLNNAAGQPLVIDGLWTLIFGNGGNGGAANTLYFSAGPDDETHGLFGSLSPVAGP